MGLLGFEATAISLGLSLLVPCVFNVSLHDFRSTPLPPQCSNTWKTLCVDDVVGVDPVDAAVDAADAVAAVAAVVVASRAAPITAIVAVTLATFAAAATFLAFAWNLRQPR